MRNTHLAFATLSLTLTACGDLAVLPPQGNTNADAQRAFDPNDPNDRAMDKDTAWNLSSQKVLLADGVPGLDANDVLRPQPGMQWAGVAYSANRGDAAYGHCFDPNAFHLALTVRGASYDVEAPAAGVPYKMLTECRGTGILSGTALFEVPVDVTMADMAQGYVTYNQGVLPNGALGGCGSNEDGTQTYNVTLCQIAGH